MTRQPPTVVLSPHLDDAVLGAWSVLRAPGPVVVVNVCDGIPPEGVLGPYDRVKGAADSAEFARRRLAEDREALALAGREATGLGFLDAQYRDAVTAAHLNAPPLEPAEIAAALPAASCLYVPAGLGGHVDHLACRDAALSTGLPVTLYADLPYAIRAGWPAWVTGRPARPHLVPEERWEEYLPAVDLAPRAVRLPPEEVALRERALRAYATQFDALNGGPLGLLVHPEIQGFEVHWDVMT